MAKATVWLDPDKNKVHVSIVAWEGAPPFLPCGESRAKLQKIEKEAITKKQKICRLCFDGLGKAVEAAKAQSEA